MTREDRLTACIGQFLDEHFLENYRSLLLKLHYNESFMGQIREVSENTAEFLLYGEGIPKDRFKAFKDRFCEIFLDSLKFADYPEYKKIYYSVKDSGYSGKSATISVFYAMVYLDILEETKLEPQSQKIGFFQRLLGSAEQKLSISTSKISANISKEMHSNESLRKDFEDYLIEHGYKQFTPSGKPSTVYDYIGRIDDVCTMEYMDWVNLAKNINRIVPLYDRGGSKEVFGNKSHRAVINALLRYSEFLKNQEQ